MAETLEPIKMTAKFKADYKGIIEALIKDKNPNCYQYEIKEMFDEESRSPRQFFIDTFRIRREVTGDGKVQFIIEEFGRESQSISRYIWMDVAEPFNDLNQANQWIRRRIDRLLKEAIIEIDYIQPIIDIAEEEKTNE